jgi:hypothetical protein
MANRSNVMGLHGLKNKPHRNSFDLSYRNLFTAKVGELLPCFVQELNPGDSIKVNTSYFTRTAPLQSNAFTRLRENVQFFFVPYSCLWKYFDSQVLNMTKNANGGSVSRVASSINASQPVSTQMPVFTYRAVHQYLMDLINTPASDLASNDVGPQFIRGCYRHAESAKLLQLLGYGNFPEQFAEFSARLSSDADKFKIDNMDNSPYLSVFRLLAYHKICNDHYLYRQWQPYDARLCNIDYLVPSSSGILSLDSQIAQLSTPSINLEHLNFFDMRFSNLPLDYFSGVLPTAQFGEQSVVNLNLGSATGTATLSGSTSSDVNRWQTNNLPIVNNSDVLVSSSDAGAYLYTQKNGAYGTPIKHTHSVSGSASINTSLSGSLSIIALRNALAIQRYKEIQLANDVDFQSQVEAHFGIKPNDKDENSLFIGGASSMININEQVNQNLSDPKSAVYGAAPQGTGSANIKFTAKTYGVVIGIYRCTPVLDFEHVGIDRTLMKSDASDFVIPELDSIGMQQTFKCEVLAPGCHNNRLSYVTQNQQFDFTGTYGYAPRYAEYKTSFDRYNGAFCDSLKSWVCGLDFNLFNQQVISTYNALIAPNFFQCRPDIVRNIFGISKFRTSNDDPLYVGLVNMCYATRNLSRYGLPYSN